MTTDTNTAAPLPICPICGESSGFSKGFCRRISLSIEWGQATAEPVQTPCPLAGINIAELETTGQWWNQFKINGEGSFGAIGGTHCPGWILKAENLLACANKGCKDDLKKQTINLYMPASKRAQSIYERVKKDPQKRREFFNQLAPTIESMRKNAKEVAMKEKRQKEIDCIALCFSLYILTTIEKPEGSL